MWWYDQYKGKSCGRVLHGIEVFCGYHAVESVSVGNLQIDVKGELEKISFSWENENTPKFAFKNPTYQKKQFLLNKYIDDFHKAENAEYAVQLLMENITLIDWESINYFLEEKLSFPTIEQKYLAILCNYCYPQTWDKHDLLHLVNYIKKYKV